MSTATAPPPAADAPTARPGKMWGFLIVLAAVAGLAELAYAIVGVSELSVYLDRGLGLGTIVGASFGAFYLSEAVLNSPMGTLADRLGRRRLMVLGPLASVVTCVGLALLPVPHGRAGEIGTSAMVLFLRILDGAGAAALWPAVFASVGDRIEEKRRATAMSALNITYMLGIALGPLVGGYANELLGGRFSENEKGRYTPSLYMAALLFLVTAVVAYFIAPRRTVPGRETPAAGTTSASASADPHAGGAFSLAAAKNAMRRFPYLMLLAFVTFLAMGLIIPYVKLFALQRFEISETGFAKLLLYPALVIAALAVPVGRLADVWGKVRSIRAGMGVCAAALWLIITLDNAWAVAIAGVLLGLGFVLAFPAYMAFLSDLTGPEERGGTLGAVRTAQGVGALIGTVCSSLLFEKVAEQAPFYVAAGLLSLAFILSLAYIREPEPGQSEAAAQPH